MHQKYLLSIRRYRFVFFVVSRVCSAEGPIETVLYGTDAEPLGRFVQLVHFRLPGASLGFASYTNSAAVHIGPVNEKGERTFYRCPNLKLTESIRENW